MKLYVQVFLMAACVVCALALPTIIQTDNEIQNIDGVYSLLLAQVRSSLIDARALTPAEQSCANLYNNQTAQVNNQLTNQTNACFENANRTIATNNQNANVTVINIRAKVNAVQSTLANCSALQGNAEFLSCINVNFDANLRNLDEANSQAILVLAQISANATAVNVVRDGCVASVVSQAKTNLTQVANEYNNCLNMIANQRSAPRLLN